MPDLTVVIDTSVFVAGMLSKDKLSLPSQITDLWRAGAFTLVMTPAMLREIVATLVAKGIDDELIVEFVTVTARIALHIPGAYSTAKLDAIDETDNKFLAAAYESKADYLVSLDKKNLLPLKYFHGTQIVIPALFMRAIAPRSSQTEVVDVENEFEMEMSELDAEQI